MLNRQLQIFTAGLLFAFALAAVAQNSSASIQQPLEIMADPSGHLTIDQAAQGTFQPFTPGRNLAGPARAYWVRLHIRSSADENQHLYLVTDPGWDTTDLYIPKDGGFERLASGEQLPPFRRPVMAAGVAFPLVLAPGQEPTYYLRIANDLVPADTAQPFAVSLVPDRSFVAQVRRFNYLQGIYAGIVLAMFAYNLILFFSLRERTYLFYCIYVLFFGAVWILRADFLFDALWPDNPVWNAASSFYFVGIAVAASAMFVRSFFDARELSRALDRSLLGIAWASIFLLIAGTITTPQTFSPLLALDGLATSVFYGVLGLLLLLRGHQRARFFLLAWLTLICANVFYILVYLGLLHAADSAAHDAVQIGSAVECVLLAFALADRVKGIKAEAEKRQMQHTIDLEAAVVQRTRELLDANARLEAASITDPLTGLNNRRFVNISMPRLTAELMRKVNEGEASSLLICIGDLDRFKDINDTYGHETGDAALKGIAASLNNAIRGGAILARWGGEEFLVIDRLREREEDVSLAERMRRLVAEESPLQVPARELRITMSLGLAHFPLSTRHPELLTWQEVLILADRCLYMAKEAGRNRWYVARANEDALDAYVREFGRAAAAALCRSQFEKAVESGLIELLSTPGAGS
ncbi:MAG: 7TM diverse intracellular signaling domain-containing protein [Acidobacteriota bacterium]